ncbi:YDG/SRA domain-containing protein [Aquihabitans sp. McL0605]|uniref:YDG/SRA domain-containing protein n=1 Tax=Aquihabitans sp. McL0605 TaxID=3415671 RepID=UPI003CEC551D
MAKRAAVVGAIPGVPVGTTYSGRKAAMHLSMHRQHGAGIDFDGTTRLSVAVALNEGYEDDLDYGSLILYTGEGGKTDGVHTHDQTFTGGNEGLRNAHRVGSPVRVLRGPELRSPHAPSSGYRYDGLYAVTEVWRDTGKGGFQVCRFKLEGIGGEASMLSAPEFHPEIRHRSGVVTRRIRDTAVAREVKELHGFACQVCGEAVLVPGGGYAEGAHVVPLGRPHDGPDSLPNLLCLCPNDHVRLDAGAIQIEDDLSITCTLTGVSLGRLREVRGHRLSLASVRYHRAKVVTS